MSTATVIAARDGDQRALDALVAEYLPLIYNIIGRALQGHTDVDDVVQETMLRIVDGLPRLREPESFRSWAVAIAMHQVRDRHRRQAQAPLVGEPTDVADPGADFADLTITRLRLSGQRQEVVEATRWLDHDDRELLSLWWLEAAGQLTREEVVEALRITKQHAAVRVQRMKAQLDAARAVVRALTVRPRCPDLSMIVASWDGRPSALWRKRLARHTRECERCDRAWSDLVAAERLLAGVSLVPVPFLFSAAAVMAGAVATASVMTKTGVVEITSGKSGVAVAGWLAGVKPFLVGLAATAAIAGASGAVYLVKQGDNKPAAAVAAVAGSPTRQPVVAGSAPADPAPSAVASPSAVPPSSAPATKAVVPPAVRTPKKGVSTFNFTGNAQALRDVRASWYYNWSSDRSVPAIDGVEFVPMIWGPGSVNAGTLDKAKAQGKVLLGFNEPNLAGQANMTVQQALDLWPQLQATGMRLGSPAPAYGADTAGGWFDQFMSGAKARGYRVDFITLHWYGGDFSAAATNQLKGYIQNVYNRYHLPIWLTEFALMRFDGGTQYPTQDQQTLFVNNATAMLQGLSYVERYAWFSLPSSKSGDTGLYANGATPTGVGAAYRAAGG